MNYLAHIYLSGTDTELRIGNFIADSVRGKDFSMFPRRIAQGIMLHRFIDTYTDTHATVRKSKDVIRAQYGHWSSVIIDMFYDHYLASNWSDYHDQPLETYVQEFYLDLKLYYEVLPIKVQRFTPVMISKNWLLSYATIAGLSDILNQMNARTKGRSKMQFAVLDLEKHYKKLENQFRDFFEDLQIYVQQEVNKLEDLPL